MARKYLYVFLGLIFLVLAYFGIIMPGVPAIPFILLSAWLFLQSSDRLYDWLRKRKYIGKVIEKYFSGNKVSKGAIWFVISQWWVSLIVAQVIIRPDLKWIVLINVIGVIGSVLIYLLLQSQSNSKEG